MAIQTSTSASADGPTPWLRLRKGTGNTLNVDCANWNGSTVVFEYSKSGEDSQKKNLPDEDGNQFTATENEVLRVDAIGFVRGIVSTYGGTPIEIEVDG